MGVFLPVFFFTFIIAKNRGGSKYGNLTIFPFPDLCI